MPIMTLHGAGTPTLLYCATPDPGLNARNTMIVADLTRAVRQIRHDQGSPAVLRGRRGLMTPGRPAAVGGGSSA
jgi:hypothetical protein